MYNKFLAIVSALFINKTIFASNFNLALKCPTKVLNPSTSYTNSTFQSNPTHANDGTVTFYE